MSQLKDEIVLVTGANRGIGRAILAEAIRRGSNKVYAAVREVESAEPLRREFGEKVVPLPLDLSRPETVKDAAAVAQDVTLVINNAGALAMTTALDDDAIASLESLIDINASGLLRVAQAFAPVLEKNGGGTLVQVNSVVSVKAYGESMAYSASKAASYSITQSLREQLASRGTKVISVHPGPIATDMANQAGIGQDAEPPSVVAEALFEAWAKGEFHVFPDSMAKSVWSQYEPYAKAVIEPSIQPVGA